MASLLKSFSIDFTPLRQSRNYRLLYAGQFVSGFGSAMSYVVLPWQMYQLTKSSLLVGLVGVAEFVPMFLFAFAGGALADYVDRRRLIVGAEIGMALCSALVLANSLQPHPHVWALFFAASLMAAFNSVHRPALEGLTPRLLPLEYMPAVSALRTFAFSFNSIIGAALAGVIAANLGASWAYGVDLSSWIIGILLVIQIPSVPMVGDAPPPSFRSIGEGLRYARRRQELLGTYLIDINAMFFGMPVALFPAIADSYHVSVGWFYSMMAIGPMIATLTSGWIRHVNRHGLAVVLAVLAWGLAIVGFGAVHQLAVALFFLALAGAADCVSGLFRMTIWSQTIPDRLRGRLAGIEMVSYLSGPYLGNAESGLVASAFGLRASVVSGGILCVFGAGALALLLPRFISYDGRTGLAQKYAADAGDSR